MKSLVIVFAALILCACNKSETSMTSAERGRLEVRRTECAKKCAPRAVGQLNTFWGTEVCDCDTSYVHGETK